MVHSEGIDFSKQTEAEPTEQITYDQQNIHCSAEKVQATFLNKMFTKYPNSAENICWYGLPGVEYRKISLFYDREGQQYLLVVIYSHCRMDY